MPFKSLFSWRPHFYLRILRIFLVSGSRPLSRLLPLRLPAFQGSHELAFPDSGKRVSRCVTLAGLPGCVLFFSLAIAAFFYDVSFDGQLYHQDAILRLVRGWNPLLETGPTSYTKITDYYPKAAWIIAASLQCATGSIESGKALNILLVIASFFIARRSLAATGLVPARGRTIVATLLALNPVSVCQLFSFMVDGCLASLLVILMGLMIILYRSPSRWEALQLGIAGRSAGQREIHRPCLPAGPRGALGDRPFIEASLHREANNVYLPESRFSSRYFFSVTTRMSSTRYTTVIPSIRC